MLRNGIITPLTNLRLIVTHSPITVVISRSRNYLGLLRSKPILNLEDHGVDALMSATIEFPQDVLDELVAAPAPDDLLPCSPPTEEMTKAQDDAKAQRRNFRLALAAFVVSILIPGGNLGYQFYRDRHTGASNEARFKGIEFALRVLTQTVAPQIYKSVDDSLRSALSLSPAEAAPKLASAASAIKQLQAAKAPVPVEDVNATAQELGKVADTHGNLPETWNVVGQFISYRSQMAEGWIQISLPSCYDQSPKSLITKATSQGKQTILEHTPPRYEGCEIDLGAPVPAMLSLPLQASGARQLDFSRCRVVYKGGPINLLGVVPRLTFSDSIFDVSIPSSPTGQERQLIMSLLLTNDATHVDFSKS